jgi:2,3-bisphosphoglycerate-independent phosphoglycerate mutase
VALRLNFATADGTGTILDSRVGRSLSTREAQELARGLTQADLLADLGIRAEVRATVGHRGVLWLHPTRDGGLSPEISNADPFYEKIGGMGAARRPERPTVLRVEPLDATPAAARTADAVNRFLEASVPVLAGHRVNAARALSGRKIANALLVRNAGALPREPLPSFESRHSLRGAAVTEMPVERGIARTLGLEDRYLGPMTGDRDAGYRERAKAVRELLGRVPFVYVHLKGPDEPGHDGNALAKREIVEAIDRSFFGPFLEGLDLQRVRLAVTADHATPCILKGHSDDPVPLVIVGSGTPPTGTTPEKFGDAAAARGALGVHRGIEVLPLLFSVPFGRPSA